MKKTKIWLILLAMMMTLFMSAGCGEEKKDNKSDVDNDSLAKVEDVLNNETKDESDKDNDETDESEDDEADKKSESGDGDVEPSGESDASSDGETESSEEETTSNSQSSDESVRPTGPDTTVDDSDISSGSPEDITTDKQEITTTKKQETTTTKKQETTTKANTTTQATTTKSSSSNSDTTVNNGAIINKGSEDYLNRYSKRGITATEKAKAETILKNILKTSMSEVERVRAIHDWLVKNVNYDYDTANNMSGVTGQEAAFSATGSLINGLAVCEGYSEGFLLLCWTAGIDAMLVEGTANGGGHEWNVVNIDGSWYQVDVTWDDPGVAGSNGSTVNDTTGSNLRYDYFLITTADMQADHTITGCFDYNASNWYATVPSCTSTAFYDYAEQCTFEHQLSDGEYTIVSSYDEVTTATKNYLGKGITAFKIVYTIGVLDESKVFETIGKAAANYYGAGISYSYYPTIQASGYTIIEITSITTG